MTSSRVIRVAVLHQAVVPPVINGVSKPPKPGGYQDSSADIAFALLHHQPSSTSTSSSFPPISVVTPHPSPSPTVDSQWSFPDTTEGILSAVSPPHNATHLYANTVLFGSHPLAVLATQGKLPKGTKFIGQDPETTERWDDKAWANDQLRAEQGLKGWFPQSWLLRRADGGGTDLAAVKANLPVVIKPVRGRGSHGVSLVKTETELTRGLDDLWNEGELVLVEEFLEGEEVTVTVMPPGDYGPSLGRKTAHFALSVVTRFNHHDGIAPYNGIAAVTSNSRLISSAEAAEDPSYERVGAACERIAAACGAWAPIRVDARRRARAKGGNEWGLFDVNLKPNATGSGRPGRDDQDSLVMMAAKGMGWTFPELLEHIIRQAQEIPVYQDGAAVEEQTG